MHAPRAPESVRRQPPASPGRAAASRPAFTLIELVVVLTIVSILASLTLGGLAVTRQRARIDKTKSTIRKIHELIVPHYESYVRRRVSMAGASGPLARLVRARQLVMYEMPDSWEDVAASAAEFTLSDGSVTGQLPSGASIPSNAWNGITRGYGAYQGSFTTPIHRVENGSSECLYMIVSRGLGEPDVMEQFRADEIGDVDGDGAPEFIDGWGRPIEFFRWAPGFSELSQVQTANSSTHHDPFDFYRSDASAFALMPLIVSLGPDGERGLQTPLNGWHGRDLTTLIVAATQSIGAPVSGASSDHLDNITNHDLLSK